MSGRKCDSKSITEAWITSRPRSVPNSNKEIWITLPESNSRTVEKTSKKETKFTIVNCADGFESPLTIS